MNWQAIIANIKTKVVGEWFPTIKRLWLRLTTLPYGRFLGDACFRAGRMLPPETAHDLGIRFLQSPLAPKLLSSPACPRLDLSVEIPGLGSLAHPIGLAAGFDKNGVALGSLNALGFSTIEIGTITPSPQFGHPKPRVFRYPDTHDLINRMGFPSLGAQEVERQLRSFHRHRHSFKLGINVGKNHQTPLDRAIDDYLSCLDRLKHLGDYYVINVSSPNTEGLRDLATPGFIKDLSGEIAQIEPGLPKKTWIKLDPDLSKPDFQALIESITTYCFGGVILTNTRKVNLPERGGLSGHSLRSFALQRLMWAKEVHQHQLGVMAVGGIMSGSDVLESLRLGAHGVGIYTALVYRGPSVVSKLIGEIEQQMEALSLTHLRDLRELSTLSRHDIYRDIYR